MKNPFQTSWGVTTRMIGAIIMAHGDDNGLVLPPAVAPVQIMVVPVQMHKEGVLDAARAVCERLGARFRCKIDESDRSPGWKFAEYEMKGVPLRLEMGPRDIEQGQCVIVRRDNREKYFVALDDLEEKIPAILADYAAALYKDAYDRREKMTYTCTDLDDFIATAQNKPGFIRAMWCGDEECETKLKEIADVTSRCMPFDEEPCGDKCICCGKPADKLVYWGKAY